MKSSRVNAAVRRELSNIIQNEIKDPRIHPMTTVVDAEVTADLKYCKVFISVMADERSRQETMEGLKKAAPFIRHMLAETVNLRNTPELKFIADDSIEQAIRMRRLIDDVSGHDEEIRKRREAEEAENAADQAEDPEATEGQEPSPDPEAERDE